MVKEPTKIIKHLQDSFRSVSLTQMPIGAGGYDTCLYKLYWGKSGRVSFPPEPSVNSEEKHKFLCGYSNLFYECNIYLFIFLFRLEHYSRNKKLDIAVNFIIHCEFRKEAIYFTRFCKFHYSAVTATFLFCKYKSS